MAILIFSLVLQGSLFDLWGLHRDLKDIKAKTLAIKDKSKQLTEKLKRVHDPKFLEVEAQNQLDLAGESDIVFVFSESPGITGSKTSEVDQDL